MDALLIGIAIVAKVVSILILLELREILRGNRGKWSPGIFRDNPRFDWATNHVPLP